MDLDRVRSEVEHMRVQVGRQRKEILQLQRAGISTAAVGLLLQRMQAQIEGLCDERDRLEKEEGGPTKGRVFDRQQVSAAARMYGCDTPRRLGKSYPGGPFLFRHINPTQATQRW